jgi:hypothetical protein
MAGLARPGWEVGPGGAGGGDSGAWEVLDGFGLPGRVVLSAGIGAALKSSSFNSSPHEGPPACRGGARARSAARPSESVAQRTVTGELEGSAQRFRMLVLEPDTHFQLESQRTVGAMFGSKIIQNLIKEHLHRATEKAPKDS